MTLSFWIKNLVKQTYIRDVIISSDALSSRNPTNKDNISSSHATHTVAYKEYPAAL